MREALELALYSFRYLDDVTMVAVLLPPSAKDDATASTSTETKTEPTRAVFYRPGDLLRAAAGAARPDAVAGDARARRR